MYWVTYLVLASLIATQAQCGFRHAFEGFVVRKLPKITCISNPANDVCPVDHKVPDLDQNLTRIDSKSIKEVLNRSTHFLRLAGGSDECINANEGFQCSRIIHVCETNLSYVYSDSDKVHRRCVTAREKCNGTGMINLNKFFNCTHYVNATMRYDKPEMCKEYPDVEMDTCPKRNYKVPKNANFTSFVEMQKTAKRMLKENNVTTDCTNHVLIAVCYIGSPACTKDEMYEVSLLGKTLCLKTMKCLESANNTILTKFATNLCQKLPEEDTAKNISIKDIENPIATTKPPVTGTTASKTRILTTSTTVGQNTTTEAPCCVASRLSTLSHIFIVCLFIRSVAI